MSPTARESGPRSNASRLGAIAVGAALLAALIVPILLVLLAGPGLDANTRDGHAAGDVAGIASAAVGGAQRLLVGARNAVPVALPVPAGASTRPADRVGARPAPPPAFGPAVATTDAARAPDETRPF